MSSLIALGDYAIRTKEIDETHIRSSIKLLEKIEKPSRKDKINNIFKVFNSLFGKSKILKFIIYLFFDFILAVLIFYVGTNFLNIDKNYSFTAEVGAFVLLLIYI